MAIYKQGSSTTIGTKYANPQPNSGGNAGILNAITQNSSLFIRARVLDIVLNNDHPRFTSVGEWNGIGTIYFEPLDNNSITVTYAYPIFPQIKMYPLVNEIVLLAAIPSKFSENEKTVDLIYYYFPPIGIWNHPHHNAYPNITSNSQLLQQSANDYVNTSENDTFVRRVGDGSTEINLNFTQFANPNQDTFVEKANIHPLLPFNGDIIYEGRWGNSIRFGSTTVIPQGSTRPLIPNNWSSTGSNGDPITILRNGQPMNSTDEGWIPITENISNDLSSIYLTSYQKVPFSISNENFVSYTTPPTTPSQFINPQIILNSDRIILNAKSDSVLISGENSVGLSSNGSINMEAKQVYLDGTDIRIGSKNASQSALKGDDTVEYLKILVNELKNITEALKTIQNWPQGTPVPNSTMLTVANSAQKVFENVYNNIDSIKSTFIKLK
jgi:hypothetical protein